MAAQICFKFCMGDSWIAPSKVGTPPLFLMELLVILANTYNIFFVNQYL